MDLGTVDELKKLYSDLAELDGKLKAMLTAPSYADTPLQKVTFYQRTSTFSGPTDYEPKHAAKAIAAWVIKDMNAARVPLVTRIQKLGFEAPPPPRPNRSNRSDHE